MREGGGGRERERERERDGGREKGGREKERKKERKERRRKKRKKMTYTPAAFSALPDANRAPHRIASTNQHPISMGASGTSRT